MCVVIYKTVTFIWHSGIHCSIN